MHMAPCLIFNSIIDQLKNYVSDSILEGLIATSSDWISEVLDKIVGAFFELFRPQISTFKTYLGDTSLFDIFGVIGMLIAVLILVLSFFLMFRPWNTRMSDTPFSLIARFIVAGLFIIFGSQIADVFFTITNDVWDILLGISVTANEGNHDILMQAFLPVSFILSLGFEPTNPLVLILTIILGVKLFIEVAKLIVEIIERYCVACILYYMFPTVSGTIVSSVTVSIFLKYIQMLLVQLFMLIMNLLFVRIILRMITVPITITTIPGWLFMFAIIKCAQKMDNYLYTMGMSVAVTGASLFDSIGCTSRGITNLLRGSQSGLSTAGGILTKAGINNGNTPLAKAGMAFSSFAHPSKSNMSGNYGLLQEAQKNGNLASFGKQISGIDNELVNVAKAGGREALLLNSLNNDVKQDLFKEAFGTQAIPENATLSNLQWNANGGITGELISTDDPDLSTAFELSGKPDNLAFAEFTGNDGESLYMKASGNLAAGETCSYSYDGENLQMGDVLTGNRIGELENIRDDVAYLEGTEQDGVLLKDHNNNTLAYLDKEGGAHYNLEGMQLSQSTLSKINAFKSLEPSSIRFEANDNDTIDVFGKEKGSDMAREFQLFSRSTYMDKSLPQGGKVVSMFGKNNPNTGSYYVTEKPETKKEASKNTYSEISKNHPNAKTYWRKEK